MSTAGGIEEGGHSPGGALGWIVFMPCGMISGKRHYEHSMRAAWEAHAGGMRITEEA